MTISSGIPSTDDIVVEVVQVQEQENASVVIQKKKLYLKRLHVIVIQSNYKILDRFLKK